MQTTPQNSHEWVCAWVDNINLNSPEKSDDEIKAFLKARGYASKRSLKYSTSPVVRNFIFKARLAGFLSFSNFQAGLKKLVFFFFFWSSSDGAGKPITYCSPSRVGGDEKPPD